MIYLIVCSSFYIITFLLFGRKRKKEEFLNLIGLAIFFHQRVIVHTLNTFYVCLMMPENVAGNQPPIICSKYTVFAYFWLCYFSNDDSFVLTLARLLE